MKTSSIRRKRGGQEGKSVAPALRPVPSQMSLKFPGLLALFFTLVCLAAGEDSDHAIRIVIRSDKPAAIYQLNEPAVFTIQVFHQEREITSGEVALRLSYDNGSEVYQNKKVNLSDSPLEVKGVLNKPGFLRCDVSYIHQGETFSDRGAVAYAPEKLRAFAEEPEDFDSFWRSAREQLARQPLDPRIDPISADDLVHLPAVREEFLKNRSEADHYQISFTNLNRSRIYGLLSVPKKIEGPFPVHVTIASAGVGKPDRPYSYFSSHRGVMVLQMGVHDVPLLQAPSVYEQLSLGRLKHYQQQGKPDREKYYLRRVILGLDRAITYMATRPDYNQTNLVVYGGSQGGGLTLVMAGLNRNITAAISRVPGLCDHSGMLAGRRSGWPGIARYIADSEAPEPYLRMAMYYDAVSFARRIDVPLLMNVAFLDDTCPPSGQYCAFNQIKREDKQILHDPLLGHFQQSPEFLKLKNEFLNEHLGIK